MCLLPHRYLFFFFNDTATTEIYTLSLHDALPIFRRVGRPGILEGPRHTWQCREMEDDIDPGSRAAADVDRKSTRLNSSHSQISYAVFCLKKKKIRPARTIPNVTAIKHTLDMVAVC